jgi:hypothetical protein
VSRKLAVDIGLRELKIVEADGARLTGHAEILLPDGAIEDGMPTPLLTVAIRGAMEAARIRTGPALVAIADTGIAVRDFVLPRIPKSELSEAVLFEGRRLVPLDPNSVYYAWHAQSIRSGRSVYLVAARRDMIDALTATVTEAALRVGRIDVKPLALARGAGVTDGLILEWGASEATLVLMVQGRPRFFRSFLLDSASDNVDAQLDELAFSLSALVRFMRTAAPDATIGPRTDLHLVGRVAFIEDGYQRAQQRFEFAVRPPKAPSLKMPSDFPWQAHLAGIGLLQRLSWRSRLEPSQGGDVRVAA